MSLRLLIVDDDPEISGLMRLRLSREAPHLTIAVVDGGQECMEYVQNRPVDCILSDYQMPGMDGMDLLKSLRSRGNDVPFIFLTGQGNEEVAREAFKSGAYDYFTKEIGFAHFARIINSVEQAVRQADAERAKSAFESALLDEKNKTGRARADAELRESEARFRSLAEESLAGIYIMQEQKFIYVNPRLAEIFGYAPEELIGKMGAMDIVAPEEREKVREKIRMRLSGEVKSAHYQLRGQRKDGGGIDVEVYGSQTMYDGRPVVIGTLLDVTERKRAEKEKDAVFHMLTHDIKGPLTLIYGYAQILDRELGKEHSEMVGGIGKAARRISALIDDMLTFSGVESPGFRLNMEQVALKEVLSQAVKESRLAASEIDVTIGVEMEDGLPEVLADRMQLARVFGNLVSNAVKYNRRGGKVRVRAWAEAAVPGHVMVEVSDTGVGIHEEDLPHVFEKYYRGRKADARRGTGLGLAVVKAVVLAHGGSVSAASGESGGSTFRVALPARQGE